MSGDWRKTWTTLGMFGLAFTATIPMASAFFPPIPQPGEVVTVVPPTTVPPVIVPPVTPVPPVCVDPHQPVEKPVCTCDPGTPQSVPEPATIIATVTGLAALGGWKLRKK
jgi:hypothetical protein